MKGLDSAPKGIRLNRRCSSLSFKLNRNRNASLSLLISHISGEKPSECPPVANVETFWLWWVYPKVKVEEVVQWTYTHLCCMPKDLVWLTHRIPSSFYLWQHLVSRLVCEEGKRCAFLLDLPELFLLCHLSVGFSQYHHIGFSNSYLYWACVLHFEVAYDFVAHCSLLIRLLESMVCLLGIVRLNLSKCSP